MHTNQRKCPEKYRVEVDARETQCVDNIEYWNCYRKLSPQLCSRGIGLNRRIDPLLMIITSQQAAPERNHLIYLWKSILTEARLVNSLEGVT